MISQPAHAAFIYHQPDPVAFSIGSFGIHWYGLMYLLGFLVFYLLACYRAGRSPWNEWTKKKVEDLLFWGVFGVIVGGRLGFVLFYQPSYFLNHPLEALYIHQGGMSFHGGLVGVIIVMWLWGHWHGMKFFEVADFCAPIMPVGLITGRIGNFINGELVGRPTDVPWAMIFPQVDNIPRHPSQLYQFALEGLLLFAFLWWFSSKKRPLGIVSAAFLIGYGLLRFAVEFTRQPDVYVGYLAGHLTMGQYLSLPMIAAGIILGWWFWHRQRL